jgi:subtilisin-like proprotein convertase family protein
MSETITPLDPVYALQWHLHVMGDLERVWVDYQGSGVSVGIYDGGVDYTHPDIAPNYDPSLHVVIRGRTLDGAPTGDEDLPGHGSLAAGLIGAAMDGRGTVGIAPKAGLTGVNIADPNSIISKDNGSVSDFTAALRQMDRFDVIYTMLRDGTQYGTTHEQYEWVVENGRGGLGTIIVQPGDKKGEDANTLMANRFTISVPALRQDGYIDYNPAHGAAMLVSAPGESGAIVAGGSGYHDLDGVDYRADFGETSASAAMVAGVVALILDANPDLGWRDVNDILAMGARHTGSDFGRGPRGDENDRWVINHAKDWNGGGMHFSRDYGFGAVDAYASVRIAEAYGIMDRAPAGTSANEAFATSGLRQPVLSIPDGNSSLSYSFNVSTNIRVQQLELYVDTFHPNRAELQVALTSPTGTRVNMLDTLATQGRELFGGMSQAVAEAFRGEMSAGRWTVTITDTVKGDAGRLAAVKLDLFGDAVSNDDVYTYTSEFAAVRALDPSRGTLRDTNGGVDWINAAAVMENLRLDLSRARDSTVNGATLRIEAGTVIENAIGGDGFDTLVGNSADNRLYGGRGNDRLAGNGGDDTLVGGDGDDRLFGQSGSDVIVGGPGRDLLSGGTGADLFKFTKLSDTPLTGPAEVITDFEDGLDRIALPVDSLTLIGSAQFRGGPNEMRMTNAGGHTFLELDADGDRVADFRLQLNGLHTLQMSDFLLI